MSIKRIQQITGFSYSTISRVLNGKAQEFRISDKTRQAIFKAAESLNYRPNILARSLRLKRTYTIGLIVPDIKNPFFGELASRIEKLLREQGYSTILCNTNEIPENEEFYLKVLVDRQVDGIIIAPIHTKEWDAMEHIRRERSIVLIDRIFYETDIPWVTSANEQAADEVTSELIAIGYPRIAYLGGTAETYINTMRFSGYRKALERHSLSVDERIVFFEGYSPEAGEEMMATLLEREPDTRAVFCVNNLVFIGAMKVVQKHEIETGRSIMMAAFDIDRYCEIFKRPLLCARQDQEKLAANAVALLIEGIRNTVGPDRHLIVPVCVGRHRIR
ncbi:MAG: LacI family DNA-binding transcriptional regulator [Candidatus Aminicenantes bacterium]|nr:LacI family DNA-binding transcriptional regulator [Candidatus Aminicenantes bacterium]